MSYTRKRVLSEKITYSNNSVNLPRDAVISEIILNCSIAVSNAGAAAWSATYEDVLAALEVINVTSNGNITHYNISGLDAAVLTYYFKNGKGVNPDDAVSVGAGATSTFTFVLRLPGLIFAMLKESLQMSITWKTTLDTDVTVDTSSSYVEIAVDEIVYESMDEFMADYGQNFELVKEPKIRALTTSLTQNTELSDALELSVGNILIRKGFIIAFDSGGSRSNSVISKFAVVESVGGLRTRLVNNFTTSQNLDEGDYNISALTGITVIDYDSEVQPPYGLHGWAYNKGDLVLQTKNAANGTLRYLSVEEVVNNPVV